MAGIDTAEIKLEIGAHLRFSKHILHIWKQLSNAYPKSILNFSKYTKKSSITWKMLYVLK